MCADCLSDRFVAGMGPIYYNNPSCRQDLCSKKVLQVSKQILVLGTFSDDLSFIHRLTHPP